MLVHNLGLQACSDVEPTRILRRIGSTDPLPKGEWSKVDDKTRRYFPIPLSGGKSRALCAPTSGSLSSPVPVAVARHKPSKLYVGVVRPCHPFFGRKEGEAPDAHVRRRSVAAVCPRRNDARKQRTIDVVVDATPPWWDRKAPRPGR
jgi:hypothetical protein